MGRYAAFALPVDVQVKSIDVRNVVTVSGTTKDRDLGCLSLLLPMMPLKNCSSQVISCTEKVRRLTCLADSS